MANIFTGQRPDLTPAQIVSGIPVLAELLHTFGVYDLSRAQQDSLAKTATWALALVAGDTILRVGRNVSMSRVQAAAVALPPAPSTPGASDSTSAADGTDGGPSAAVDTPDDPLGPEELPGDAEEFDAPPPGLAVPPSQRTVGVT